MESSFISLDGWKKSFEPELVDWWEQFSSDMKKKYVESPYIERALPKNMKEFYELVEFAIRINNTIMVVSVGKATERLKDNLKEFEKYKKAEIVRHCNDGFLLRGTIQETYNPFSTVQLIESITRPLSSIIDYNNPKMRYFCEIALRAKMLSIESQEKKGLSPERILDVLNLDNGLNE